MNKISKIFKMENLLYLISFIAIAITTINVNTACPFVMHQPKLPSEAKKLRKF